MQFSPLSRWMKAPCWLLVSKMVEKERETERENISSQMLLLFYNVFFFISHAQGKGSFKCQTGGLQQTTEGLKSK